MDFKDIVQGAYFANDSGTLNEDGVYISDITTLPNGRIEIRFARFANINWYGPIVAIDKPDAQFYLTVNMPLAPRPATPLPSWCTPPQAGAPPQAAVPAQTFLYRDLSPGDYFGYRGLGHYILEVDPVDSQGEIRIRYAEYCSVFGWTQNVVVSKKPLDEVFTDWPKVSPVPPWCPFSPQQAQQAAATVSSGPTGIFPKGLYVVPKVPVLKVTAIPLIPPDCKVTAAPRARIEANKNASKCANCGGPLKDLFSSRYCPVCE